MTNLKSFPERVTFSRCAVQASLELAERPVVSSKFGPYSAVLLHLITREYPAIPVIWADTGFDTPETHEFADGLKSRLNLNLKTYTPSTPWHGVIPEYGTNEHERFVHQTKLEPFSAAHDELQPDVWFSAIRRSQTNFRSGLNFFNKTAQNLLKVSPLLDWHDDDMAEYISRHELPVIDNFQDPTKPEPHLECGLHPEFS